MDNFFALIKKYYTNFAIRNGILIALGLILGQIENSLQQQAERENPFSLALLGICNYGLIVFYNHIILRLFLFQKRIILFSLLFVSYMAILTLFIMYGSPGILGDPFKTDYARLLPDIIFNTILISLFYFFHYFFLQYIKQQEIELLNHKTEIENLKQQLNPHFLFNSLNNLYGVSLANPADVSNKIIELSDLLKYQIETSKKDYSSLEGEKEFIEKYINYSKWKLQNITINSTETGEAKNYRLTPMIFAPLLENAIKYSNFDKNPIINIHWVFSNSKFSFKISNTFNDNQSEPFSTKSGLKNLKKRLELFHPKSSLEIEEKNNVFTANVTIWDLTIHA